MTRKKVAPAPAPIATGPRYVVAAWLDMTGSRPTGRRLGQYGERAEYEPAPEAKAVVWCVPETWTPTSERDALAHLETSQKDAALRGVYTFPAEIVCEPQALARAKIMGEHSEKVARAARLDAFMKAYEPSLATARENDPERYAFPASEVPIVAARMREAFDRGSFNHDGAAIRAACRAVGIRHTRNAILAYLEGGTS